jgi:hypothetical protein
MELNRPQKWALSFAFAVALTTVVAQIDAAFRQESRGTVAERLARQVAEQTEALRLTGREAAMQDPLAWAVRQLSQGVEPRVVLIAKSKGAPLELTLTPQEDRASGRYEFSKSFEPASSEGVRIQLDLGYAGFLGSPGKLRQDLSYLLFTLIGFVIILGMMSLKGGTHRLSDLKKSISEWGAEAKDKLLLLGGQLKEVLKFSDQLILETKKSRSSVASLRESLHQNLNAIHESAAEAKGALEIHLRIQKTLARLAAEIREQNGDSSPLLAPILEMQLLQKDLLAVNHKTALSLRSLDRTLEPWTLDVDQAYHSFEQAFSASENVKAHARKTSESLVGQAKLINLLNYKLAHEPDPKDQKDSQTESEFKAASTK